MPGARPTIVSRRRRRQLTGRALFDQLSEAEPDPLLWFTWRATWLPDVDRAPHPPMVWRVADPRAQDGLLRFTLPSTVAKLRWSDYLARNPTPRWMRNGFSNFGNPADWLASDQPVRLNVARAIDVYDRDRWVSIDQVDVEAFETWALSRHGVSG